MSQVHLDKFYLFTKKKKISNVQTLLKQLLCNCYIFVDSFARIRQHCPALESHLDQSMFLKGFYYCALERQLQQQPMSNSRVLNNFSEAHSAHGAWRRMCTSILKAGQCSVCPGASQQELCSVRWRSFLFVRLSALSLVSLQDR